MKTHHDLSDAADPAGTCPVCRAGHLIIDTRVPFAASGPTPRHAPAAVCVRCGYVYEILPGDTVAGATA